VDSVCGGGDQLDKFSRSIIRALSRGRKESVD